jgi:hypothetical protein
LDKKQNIYLGAIPLDISKLLFDFLADTVEFFLCLLYFDYMILYALVYPLDREILPSADVIG